MNGIVLERGLVRRIDSYGHFKTKLKSQLLTFPLHRDGYHGALHARLEYVAGTDTGLRCPRGGL